MLQTLRSAWNNVRHPVAREREDLLQEIRASIPEKFRTREQAFGRSITGCAATLGVMPRCDFACTGCYLGEEANRIPRLSLEAVKEQMQVIRRNVGPGGNLQITDGEVTLLPPEELIELIRYARSLELIPMVMSHGDTFLRKPGLLQRLVLEGGLAEVSIHVDTTQRGRKGAAYKHAKSELELMPLRDEFAELLRRVRSETRRPLRAATTMTVTPENLHEVAAVTAWTRLNADAFGMISFQPMAQVGRTVDGLGDQVDTEELWEQIARGLYGEAASRERMRDGSIYIGHPECTRYALGLSAIDVDGRHRYQTIYDKADPRIDKPLFQFLDNWGGLEFRMEESGLERAGRVLGMVLQKPGVWLGGLVPFLVRLMQRFDPEHPWRFVGRVLTRRSRIHHFSIVSHHFMSRRTIETPVGQERLAMCIFKLPVHGKMVSMCEVNGLGVREEYYEEIRQHSAEGKQAETSQPVGV